jgi:hypothetical protein
MKLPELQTWSTRDVLTVLHDRDHCLRAAAAEVGARGDAQAAAALERAAWEVSDLFDYFAERPEGTTDPERAELFALFAKAT